MTAILQGNHGGQKIQGYFTQLDGLRAIAISLVLIEHFGGPLGSFYSGGYYGVDLFFVISGFLITSILLKNRDISFGGAYRTFMGRRVLRIFPVYYLALLIFYAVDFATTRSDIGWLATYTWNYAAVWNKGENYLFYLWSLSVEEQYYLFWPFLVLALRHQAKSLLLITLGIVAIGYGQLIWNIFPSLSEYNYTGLPNRMGSLGLGSAGAIAMSMGWKPEFLYKSVWVEIVTIGGLAWALTASGNIRLPLLGLCSLVLVLKAVKGEFRIRQIGMLLSSGIAVFIGRISYGIYIYHWPLGIMLTYYVFDPIWLQIDFSALGLMEKLRWHSWIIKLPLYYISVVGVAYVSHRYFEKPLLNLKDRWFPTGQLTKASL